ncbi:MAG: hypothetical protein QXY87_11375 [Saccharolobus sp.]|uniref:Uncharacterized protein n=2 Tax=Saccharolobus shibatae TaxID=2286 RepID=A0A8F5GZM4_9CREN|nr:hypothetical protein [Saccharolobus shibatae]MCH4816469.1 hypothetical protein [Saccharolobus shibatae]QXJ29030.1 hypothetical protein J5U23_01899 [Saccharolobus shibatae B12]QXJ32254.1 hypothetical protein J5U21_01905 [Saccharolobus shibatae]QXJ35280.1 hypothetical protein J5U22_01827 [Saccharolobus shibatae]
MDKYYLIAFIILCLGIMFDGILIVFFVATVTSLILPAVRRRFPLI